MECTYNLSGGEVGTGESPVRVNINQRALGSVRDVVLFPEIRCCWVWWCAPLITAHRIRFTHTWNEQETEREETDRLTETLSSGVYECSLLGTKRFCRCDLFKDLEEERLFMAMQGYPKSNST